MIISPLNILTHFYYIINRLENFFLEYQTLSLISKTLTGIILIFHLPPPPPPQDYQNFEINNSSVALNILQMNDQEEIDYLYESKFNNTRRNIVNLLLLENKHYVAVKNLESLLS